MRLVVNKIQLYPAGRSRRSRGHCGLLIYHGAARGRSGGVAVVVVSQLGDDPGQGVRKSIRTIANRVVLEQGLDPESVVWVIRSTLSNNKEVLLMVDFSYIGRYRVLGRPSESVCTREAVEFLIGSALPSNGGQGV